MADLPLKNYREVGSFDLLSPPLTPIGLIDGHTLGLQIKELFESGSRHIVLDCSGLEFLYSDTLTILGQAYKILHSQSGSLGLMSSSQSIAETVKKSELANLLTIYPVETDLIQASMRMMSGIMPEVESGNQQHDHDLEVVEAEVNQGFEAFEEEFEAIPIQAQNPAKQAESFEMIEAESQSKPSLAGPSTRHDQTAAIEVLNVVEEQFDNPRDVSQEMEEAPEGVKVQVQASRSQVKIFLILFILIVLSLGALWYLGVLKING